jgi:hypothetical protein
MFIASTNTTENPATASAFAYFQTHWDREWYEPFPLYQQRLAEVVKHILTLLAAPATTTGKPILPCFTLDGQTVLLEDVAPLLSAEEKISLHQYLASGRLHVGPWFVMPDTVLVSGESLIRNLQLGIAQAKQYGCTEFTGYLPDTFGQPSSLPTLLTGMGIDTAIVWRGRGLALQPSAFFEWASHNNDTILTYQLAEGYFHLFLQDETLSIPEKMAELTALTKKLGRFSDHEPLLLPLGGDHLGPPEAETLLAFDAYTAQCVTVVHPHEFMAHAQTVFGLAQTVKPPTHTGHLRAIGSSYTQAPFLLTGTLSARMKLKLANAWLEHRLTQQTERWLAWNLHAQKPLPTAWETSLATAWRLLLLNHPHDSICGCSVEAVHRANEVRFDEANAYAEGLEARTRHLLGFNVPGLHGWNGSTVAISGVVPVTLYIAKQTADEPETVVKDYLKQVLPSLVVQTTKTVLVDAYKTDFRQVPLSHLTQWCVQGWIPLAPENVLPALSTSTQLPLPAFTSAGIPETGTFVSTTQCVETAFFRIAWDEHQFQVYAKTPHGEQPMPLPLYRATPDEGDSYNRQPSSMAETFGLQTVTVLFASPLTTQWQLTFKTASGDALFVTLNCVADEPVVSITTRFTPMRPFIAIEQCWVETAFPERIQAFHHTGWETHHYTPEQLQARQAAFPITHPQDEWEPLGGIFQAGLQTATHAIWQLGCYAYEIENTSVVVPLHRGFGVLSGGKMPVRGCPAGPPFETPLGQGIGEPLTFTGLWGYTAIVQQHSALLAKATARLLGDMGIKGVLSPKIAPPKEPITTHTQLWQTVTPLPVGILLQACYPKVHPSTLQAGIIFRWLNPTDVPMTVPLPTNAVLWHCNLRDEQVSPIVTDATHPTLTIAPFSWQTVWQALA